MRLSIVAALAAGASARRDTFDISDSLLSRQVGQLEQAGYVLVRKAYHGKRPRTWLSLTIEGRRAFDSHVDARRDIVSSNGSGTASH